VAYVFTVGALSSVVASGNITVDFPASPQVGDIFVAFLALRSNVGCTQATWTKIHESLTGDTDATSGVASGQVWWWRYNGSGTNVVFSRTGGDRGQGVIIGIRGCLESGDVIDAQAISTATGTALAWGNITASSGGDPRALLAFAALGDNSTIGALTSTTPSGGTWTEAPMSNDNTGADGGASVYYHDVGLNAEATTSTLAATATVSTTYVRSTIALKPALNKTLDGQAVAAVAAVTVATVLPGAVTLTGQEPVALATVDVASISAPPPPSLDFLWRTYQRTRRCAYLRM